MPSRPVRSSSCPSISLSPFHLSFSKAILTYNKRTKNNLLFHPLASLFQSCSDPALALSLLQRHAQVFSQPRISDEQLKSLLNPTLIGLFVISSSYDEGVGLVIPDVCFFSTCILLNGIFFKGLSPEKAILVAIGILLSVRIFLDSLYRAIVTENSFRTHRRVAPVRTGSSTSSHGWGGRSIYFRPTLLST